MKKPAKLRRWRIVVIRKKGERIGTVEAATAEEAIRTAIKEYDIRDSERQRRLTAQQVE
jgi:hypothetical protein